MQYHNNPIFEYTAAAVNASQSFKRTGKTLEIKEIRVDSIIVKLTSQTALQMASKSLAGFTRKLLSIDKELGANLFDEFIYNNTLFKNIEIPASSLDTHSEPLSDSAALKRCVDIFCNDITTSREEQQYNEQIKQEIKSILFKYEQHKRLSKYATLMKTQMQ